MRNVIRTCIGCRSKLPQKTLIRFVCHSGEALRRDGAKKSPGRGAYLCYSEACIQKAFKAPQRINSLLRVQLPNSIIAQFEELLLEQIRKSASSTPKKEELS